MEEIWKDIKGYEGIYKVSSLGRIKYLERTNSGGVYVPEGIKRPQDNGNGYKYVQLKKEGTRKNFYIHRIVAECFLPNPEKLKEVNHKNENKSDNRAENLEWCTHSYNNSYGTKIERTKKHPNYIARTQRAKTKIICIYPDGRSKRFPSQVECARELGVPVAGINQVLKKRQKTHYGYRFEYDSERLRVTYDI